MDNLLILVAIQKLSAVEADLPFIYLSPLVSKLILTSWCCCLPLFSATTQAYFRLEKPVSDIVPHIARLEYDILEEIAIPNMKVCNLP